MVAIVVTGFLKTNAQNYWANITERTSTLGWEEGVETYSTPDIRLKLVKSSQTVAALSPASEPSFDFTPSDRLHLRDKDSLYHLGDINLRIKQQDGSWKAYSTAWNRSSIEPLIVSGSVLAGANLSNTLPKDIPLGIKRYYEASGKDLILRFEITNVSKFPVEIGALGVPMIFNNILEGKSLEEAHTQNVFFDPFIGYDAGYLEVKRLNGQGPVLLVLPEKNMAFEAYRPLLDDLTPRSINFEGFHEWMPHTKAYTENEWKNAEQWNTPTTLILEPGATKNLALRFVLTDNIQNIEQTLLEKERPVAIGVPGYVLPEDVNAKLFLKHKAEIQSIKVEPEGALEVAEQESNNGFFIYQVNGKKWGRARLTINYVDGIQQTVHYKVIKPEKEVVKDFGNFLTTAQWFDDKEDVFGRSPSFISYDYELKKHVLQDERVWVAGLSDEGGAGPWLGAIMKQLVQPEKKEVLKLQDFIDETLRGGIQYTEGENKYGVKRSMYYYEPDQMPAGTYRDDINYTTYAAWAKKTKADSPDRSYNYPHVAAAYWVMYRQARYYEGLVDNWSWDWYLSNAYHTAMAMTRLAPKHAQFGQMEGTVFLLILEDLKIEGYDKMAKALEAKMKIRADHWRSLNYPFGSEMPWDSTGQEEVYMWSDYFGFDEKAEITLNAILAYMPTMPHWAYNGSARRYWDFLYAGKLTRVERQLHHYGSGLNAIPVMHAYRENPELHLLRVGYGGLLGTLSNITEDGFGPAAFHSFPSTLKIDGLSGDYGPGFFGYAVNTGTYICQDQDLGWLAFGGNLKERGDEIVVDLTTAAKNRIYFAPEKLWLTLDAGAFEKIVFNKKTGEFELTFGSRNEFTPMAFLRADRDLDLSFPRKNGAYLIKLHTGHRKINLKL